MEITRNICEDDAELILSTINRLLGKDPTISSDKWPKIGIRHTGYQDYHPYCSDDVTIELDFDSNVEVVKIKMSGFLETSHGIQISFRDFDPDKFCCLCLKTEFKNKIFEIAKKAAGKRKKSALIDADYFRKVEKLLVG